MSNDTASGYNGWTNYETWAVALWQNNDQGSYEYAREQAREAIKEATDDPSDLFTITEQAAHALAELLKDNYAEASPLETEASVYNDLLRAALSEVNWHEIAVNLIEEVESE